MELKRLLKRAALLAAPAILAGLIVIARAVAQVPPPNNPPPGAYQPIPNFSGVGAGLLFRSAINDRFSGVQPIAPAIASLTFANLPTEQDGLLYFCKDCLRTSPCISGGSGAWAMGERGVWRCTVGTLESDLSANGHKVASLAPASNSGDALAFAQTGAQLNTLSGSKSDGSNAVANFNVNGVFNVKSYGAQGDCATNDQPAIQSAINAACTAGASSNMSPTVYFPPTPNSCFKTTFPIWINCANAVPMKIQGAGYDNTQVYAQGGSFPAFLVSGNNIASVLGSITSAPLIGSTGNSWNFVAGKAWGINLKSLLANVSTTQYVQDAAPFNGLAAYTVEFAFNVTDTTNGHQGTMLISAGQDNSAFLRGDGLLTAQYTIAGGGVSNTLTVHANLTGGLVNDTPINSFTFTSNATHYFAASYGSGFLQVYMDGTRILNAAASGTVLDTPGIDMFYGHQANGFGQDLNPGQAMIGQLDGLRISKVARYTGATMTVPTAKFASDSNTILLLNGTYTAPFIGADSLWGSASPNAWTIPWAENSNEGLIADLSDMQIRGGTFNVLGSGLTYSHWRNLWLIGASYEAMMLKDVPYADTFADIRVNTNPWALSALTARGGGLFSHIEIPGYGYYGIIDGIGGNEYINPYIAPGSQSLGAIVLANVSTSHQPTVIEQPLIDSENGAASPDIMLVGAQTVTIRGGDLEMSGNASPILTGFSSGVVLTLDTVNMSGLGANAPSLITCMEGDAGQITLVAPKVNGGLLSSSPYPITAPPCTASVTVIGDALTQAPSLRSYNLNGVFDPAHFNGLTGPTSLINAMTASISSGSSALSFSAGTTPANSHGIAIPGAGATIALSTPSAPSVLVNHVQDWLPLYVAPTPSGGYSYIFKPTVNNAGGFFYKYTTGGLTAVAASEPSWCQGSNACTTADGAATATRCDTCSTTYNFKSVAMDGQCGSTAASPASGAVTNASPLGYPNYIEIEQTPNVNAWSYLFYETVSNQAIMFVPASVGDVNAKQEFTYTGQTTTITSPCLSSTPPSSAINDALFTTISSGGGTNAATLAASASHTVSSETIYPDDAWAINGTIAALTAATGGVVKLPPKTFIVSQPILMGAPGGGLIEPQLVGDGGNAPYLSASPMMQGLPVIKVSNNFKPRIANLTIAASSAASPRAGIEFNVNNPILPGVTGSYIGQATVEHVAMDTIHSPQDGIEFTAAVGFDELNSENTIRDCDISAPHAALYFSHINTLQNRIYGGVIQGNDAAILLNGGSFDDVGTVFGGNGAGFFIDVENGDVLHTLTTSNAHYESSGGLLRTAADSSLPGAPVRFIGLDGISNGGNQDGLMVDYEYSNIGAVLNFDDCDFGVGENNNQWLINAGIATVVSSRGTVASVRGSTAVNVVSAGNLPNLGGFNFQNIANTGLNQSVPYCVFPYVSATLPACNSSTTVHAKAYVTDATACTNGTNYTGGGSVACMLACGSSGSWIETGAGCY